MSWAPLPLVPDTCTLVIAGSLARFTPLQGVQPLFYGLPCSQLCGILGEICTGVHTHLRRGCAWDFALIIQILGQTFHAFQQFGEIVIMLRC